MQLVLLGEKMKQDQAQAEKKRHEASQHPGSKVERVVFPRGKADWIESQRQSEAKPGDQDSQRKNPLRVFCSGRVSPFSARAIVSL